jgi:sulfate adenylyltransferase
MYEAQMIGPHGGKLISRLLTPAEGEDLKKRASALPSLTLNGREASDLRMISIGAFSPLEGFMGADDYRGVVERAALSGGLPWTIPITLSADEATADRLKPGAEAALKSQDGSLLGSMIVGDKYTYDKAKEAQKVFRTTDEAHPGVANVMKQGEVLLGGKIKAFEQKPLPIYAASDRTPAQTRALFQEKGWDTAIGFQTRNPIHRAHEYIMKCALEMVDGLMVHPLVGETKAGDTDAEVRMRCYHALLDRYYPPGRTLLSTFPAFMRYAGPKEAVFHAICRKNYGCTHFIVGRDHAGVGTYYGSYRHTADVLRELVLLQGVREHGDREDLPARGVGQGVAERHEGPRDARRRPAPALGVHPPRSGRHPHRGGPGDASEERIGIGVPSPAGRGRG